MDNVKSVRKKKEQRPSVEELYLPNGTVVANDGCVQSLRVQCRKNRDPRFVSVRYAKGGVAHYLCDEYGALASAVHMVLPPPTISRAVRGVRQERRYVGVLAHRKNQVLLKMEDGEACWMSLGRFGSQAHWPVHHYAEVCGLQEDPNWKKFCKLGTKRKSRLPSMFAEGRPRDWERKYKEAEAALLASWAKELPNGTSLVDDLVCLA